MEDQEPFSEVQELALELDKYRQAVDTAGDAVVSINQQHHEAVYMNAAAERLFGYRREEILGGDLPPLIPQEHRQSHRHYLALCLRTGQARLMGHSAELLAQRKGGSRRPSFISFSQVNLADGSLFTAIMCDLSAELSLPQQVKQSQQLAMVGQIVATVSHEISTPLVLIGGFVRQFGEEKNMSPQDRYKLELIIQEIKRLEGLLSEVNDLLRFQRYAWQEVLLPQVVERVRELRELQLRRDGLCLRLELAQRLPRVGADPNPSLLDFYQPPAERRPGLPAWPENNPEPEVQSPGSGGAHGQRPGQRHRRKAPAPGLHYLFHHQAAGYRPGLALGPAHRGGARLVSGILQPARVRDHGARGPASPRPRATKSGRPGPARSSGRPRRRLILASH
ncbi:histidine kinase [Desulfarculales bacterium]